MTAASTASPAADPTGRPAAQTEPTADAGVGSLLVEERFSIVPEWVLDAEISDAAVRLYAVLLRFGNSSGQRMPSRATLAARLRKKSKDSVDRALKELVGIGAVQVRRRSRDGVNLTNGYLVRSTPPGTPQRPRTDGRVGGGRSAAATPASHDRRPDVADDGDLPVTGAADTSGAATGRPGGVGGGRTGAARGGRRAAARVAARTRPDREFSTHKPPPPTPPTAADVRDGPAAVAAGVSPAAAGDGIEVGTGVGIVGAGEDVVPAGRSASAPHAAGASMPTPDTSASSPPSPSLSAGRLGPTRPEVTSIRAWRDERRAQVRALLAGVDLVEVAQQCARLRAGLGERAVLWTPDRLADVLAVAVLDAGWPAHAAVPALLAVAADPATRSPARLSCPGPWWDAPAPTPIDVEPDLDGDELEARLAETDGHRVALQQQARAELTAEGMRLTRAAVVRRAVQILDRAVVAS